MLRSNSQKERILEILESRGKFGVHSFELVRLVTHKATTRISELRKDGYPILRIPEKKNDSMGVRYFLEMR